MTTHWRPDTCLVARLMLTDLPLGALRLLSKVCSSHHQGEATKMTDDELDAVCASLWSDIDEAGTFPQKRPLLAHYTSIATLESILSNDELWFSNPLYMNDTEEIKFGVIEGVKAFRDSQAIRTACGTEARHRLLREAFEFQFKRYNEEHVFDTYVFSLSEHDKEDTDGKLSMWRGYGGNGQGAAIVFDAEKINYIPGTVPLITSKVTYASTNERLAWLAGKMTEFATLLGGAQIPDDRLHGASYSLFERIKMYALFTKHAGFAEEKEWRIAFLIERDLDHKFSDMLHYSVTEKGIQPRLKFKVQPLAGYSEDLSLEKLVDRIVLGPMVASQLAQMSVKRMLETVGKAGLAQKVFGSTIPYRP